MNPTELGKPFDRRGGAGKRRIGQVPICWDPDRGRAVERAHSLFRWFGGGWNVNAELPGPAAFDGASQFVLADAIPCGPALDDHLDAVRGFVDAGFTDIAIVQVGGDSQTEFLDRAESALIPALHGLA